MGKVVTSKIERNFNKIKKYAENHTVVETASKFDISTTSVYNIRDAVDYESMQKLAHARQKARRDAYKLITKPISDSKPGIFDLFKQSYEKMPWRR